MPYLVVRKPGLVMRADSQTRCLRKLLDCSSSRSKWDDRVLISTEEEMVSIIC